MTLANRIRSHLKLHPNLSVPEVADAMGLADRKTGYLLRGLCRDGTVTSDGEGRAKTFRFVRERMFANKYTTPEAKRAAERKAQNEYRARRRAEGHPVNSGPARASSVRSQIAAQTQTAIHRASECGLPGETVEQWMARTGNVPEQLPGCRYVMPALLPRRVALRGASACP